MISIRREVSRISCFCMSFERTGLISCHCSACVNFYCRTVLEDRFYVISEALEGNIDADQSTVNVKGTCVSITMRKATKSKNNIFFKTGRKCIYRIADDSHKKEQDIE